ERRVRGEKGTKARGLEQVAASAVVESQLRKDRSRVRIAGGRRLDPLLREPLAELAIAGSTGEDAADDQLRRDRSVPVVLLEPERDVVEDVGAEQLEARALPEGDRAAGVAAAPLNPEAKVLAVADGRKLGEPAAGSEQHRRRVPEPERREPPELGAEVERQVRFPGHD